MVFSQKLIDRYRELKQETPDCIPLMQVGAFMHVMNDDARAVSQVTGLKFQMAGDIDAPVVVGGFPKSGLDASIGRLTRAGHSGAIALQDGNKERRLEEIIRIQREVQAPARIEE
jgi:DNA mismatch repair ATPase MutS